VRTPAALTDGSAVCQSEHSGTTLEGDSVIVCDQFFSTVPYVRPASDDVSSLENATLYVSIVASAGYQSPITLVDRNGVSYTVVNPSGKPVMDLAKLPKNLKMPQNTIYYTLYKVIGKIRTGSSPRISILHIVPAISFTGCAIDSLALGTWEGSTSARAAPNPKTDFDTTKAVEFTVNFTTLKPERSLTYYADVSKPLPDASVFGIVGQIDSMASLATHPFAGAANNATIELFRITGMHSPGDSHIAVNYPQGTEGMSPLGMSGQSEFGIFSPAALLQARAPATAMLELEFQPHSASHPPFISVMKLHPVHIGGDSGQCSH
jgi:hypothetical protein